MKRTDPYSYVLPEEAESRAGSDCPAFYALSHFVARWTAQLAKLRFGSGRERRCFAQTVQLAVPL